MMKAKNLLAIVCVVSLCSVAAMADSISPTSVSATLDVGGSVTVTKTVTVSAEPGTTAPVDVFFLADSTGSMYNVIASVQTSMTDILTATSGLGDVQYGVGEYRDVAPPDSYSSAFAYRLDQAITADTVAVNAAVAGLAADEGYDLPEADLFALNSVATSAATGWRTGSTRILVWFGDAPGHTASGDYGLGTAPEATATAALVGANIAVQAIDVGDTSYDPDQYLDAYGQATRITDATGGVLYSGIDSTSIAQTIADAITTAIDTYSTVGLDLSEVPVGVTATSVPGSYFGSFTRSVARTFNFDLTFTLDTAATYDFNVYGLVDGGRVAAEADSINAVPLPGAVLLAGLGMLVAARKLRKEKETR